jgi:hypothetical protein
MGIEGLPTRWRTSFAVSSRHSSGQGTGQQQLDFLAAAINRSVSAVVRYSRVRTEEFTVVDASRAAVRFPTIFCPCPKTTGELSSFSSLVSIGVVGIHGQPWPEVEPTRTASAGGQLRALNRLRAEALATLPLGIDAAEIDGPVWSVSDRGTTGAFRSSRTDRGAQVLPPAGATVPPWLPAKSAHVSNSPACCALGPPSCAAPCSCHHEACSARSAWPHPGKACPSV